MVFPIKTSYPPNLDPKNVSNRNVSSQQHNIFFRINNLRSTFDVLDMDHDGKISRSDLESFYGGYIASSSSRGDVIASMITVADYNKDGFVEYDEFEKVLASKNNNARSSIMEDVFKEMDKDGDGKLGVEDLKSYLSLAGLNASYEDVIAMVKLGGDDGNEGGVTYQGFLKILAV